MAACGEQLADRFAFLSSRTEVGFDDELRLEPLAANGKRQTTHPRIAQRRSSLSFGVFP